MGSPPLPNSKVTLLGMEKAALASWMILSFRAEARGVTTAARRAVVPFATLMFRTPV